MKLLVDTQLLVRLAVAPHRLSERARALLNDRANTPHFSVVSIWEIAIKRALDRPDFTVEPTTIREGLLAAGYDELALTSEHCFPVRWLPPIHKDPFDRILIAQAYTECFTLLTNDGMIARYPGDIVRV